jgi:DNA polymerase-4/DNA polymerase V
MPLSLHSFPKAILHIDGDCFFASCEMAVNPSLRGKPVITGKERGIASSLSYEAKARGVTRGMMLSEIKKVCPEAIILPSDYETYSLFSKRMFNIVRRYTTLVEEYSIDECFADLTGLRRPLHMTYPEMAENIKKDLDSELGMTFSVGLGPNKVIAKVASKWKKPSGLTIIPGRKIQDFLKDLPTIKIWGIGPQTSAFLLKRGINTALQFAKMDEGWVIENLSKPYQEIWRELRGEFIYQLNFEEKHDYQSISKTKTFTPPSRNRDFIYSQLSKNVENALIKARRHGLAAKRFFFFLKTQGFSYRGLEFKLQNPVSIPQEILHTIDSNFERVFNPRTLYRSTGIILMDLADENKKQYDLFGAATKIADMREVQGAIDELDAKFGKHTVFLGSSFKAMKNMTHLGERGDYAKRVGELFKDENNRQRIGIPMLGETI